MTDPYHIDSKDRAFMLQTLASILYRCDDEPTTREEGFLREELSNRYGADVFRVSFCKVLVDLFIVLAVIADQNPMHTREISCEALQAFDFVLSSTPEEPVIGGSPVG